MDNSCKFKAFCYYMLTLNKQGVRARHRDIQKEARLGWIENSMPAGHMTRTEYNRRTQVKSCED